MFRVGEGRKKQEGLKVYELDEIEEFNSSLNEKFGRLF